MSVKKYWIAIEGIIGAGKSTILPLIAKKLRKHFQLPVIIIQEPVQEWQESGILQKMYDNADEWNYIAQTHFFHSRVKRIIDEVEKQPGSFILLTERSLVGDRIMWETQLETERVTVDKHAFYLQLWLMWHRLVRPMIVNAYIYLRPGLEHCIKRMSSRGRNEEEKIDTAYLAAMQRVHDATLMKLQNCYIMTSTEDYRNNVDGVWNSMVPFLEKYIAKK